MKTLYTLFLLALSTQLHAQTYDWTKTIGGSDNDDRSCSIATDTDGNFYIAGTSATSPVDFDPSADTAFLSAPPDRQIIGFLAKYDVNGNYLWARNTGQHDVTSMALDPFGNIYITGNFEDSTDLDPTSGTNFLYGNDQRDIYLIKYDSDGNFLWGKGFGGIDNDYGLKVETDLLGNAYITGYFSDTIDFDPSSTIYNIASNGGWDSYLVKYDPSGNLIWGFNLGGITSDVGKALSIDPDGNVYITGYFSATVDFDPAASVNSLSALGGVDIFIAKYDPAGNYLWARGIGNSSSGESTYSIVANNSNVFVTGSFNGTVDFDPGPGITNLISAGSSDIFYAKYTNTGNIVFAFGMGDDLDDRGNEIKIDSNENIYITGRFKNTVDFDPGIGTANEISVGGSSDIFLAKYNALGNFVWVKGMGSSVEDIGQSVTLNSLGDIYLTGWFMGTVNFNTASTPDNHTSNGHRDVFITKYANPVTSIAMDQLVNEDVFKLYPNPTNGTLFCEVSENTQLYIYNASGSLVSSQQLSAGKHPLDIFQYPTGLYLVRSSLSPAGTILVKQ